jgi:hypothetical protein
VVTKLTDASGELIYRTERSSVRLLDAGAATQYYEMFTREVSADGVSYRYTETEVDSGTLGKKHCMAMVLVPAESPQIAVSIVLEQRSGVGDGRLKATAEQMIAALEIQ